MFLPLSLPGIGAIRSFIPAPRFCSALNRWTCQLRVYNSFSFRKPLGSQFRSIVPREGSEVYLWADSKEETRIKESSLPFVTSIRLINPSPIRASYLTEIDLGEIRGEKHEDNWYIATFQSLNSGWDPLHDRTAPINRNRIRRSG